MKTELRILQGNALDVLKLMPPQSVHCVITSPPYYNLRDYGTASWAGGADDCDHAGAPMRTKANINRNTGTGTDGKNAQHREFYRQTCGKCGAERVDEQIGLEHSPEEYISKLVLVFSEVYRVLRDDGTLWLNIGDTYANDAKWGGATGGKSAKSIHGADGTRSRRHTGCKAKELIGIPWRLAFALQSSGWYLRQDIIWAKPNPMPESVRDRFTRSHEYIFLLTKRPRYFFDARAVAEECVSLEDIARRVENGKGEWKTKKAVSGRYALRAVDRGKNRSRDEFFNRDGKRNKRSVWNVATKPYADAHFATFPPELAETMVLAGTSEKGCCAVCFTPYERILKPSESYAKCLGKSFNNHENEIQKGNRINKKMNAEYHTVGWEKKCSCEGSEVIPATVLDPFGGAATTGMVAVQNRRDFVGIELSRDYIRIAEKRTSEVQINLF